MSIQKGFPSNQREISRDLPYKSDHVTAQPVRERQIGQDVVAHQFMRAVATDACEANCTTSILNLTAHSVKVGDVIRFTSGNLSDQEVRVIGITTDTVELGELLSEAPANSDTIQILRHKFPTVTSGGALQISTTSATEDSPANSGDDVTAIASVRQDTLSSDTSADGDYQFVKSNAEGELYVADETAQASLSTIAGDTTSLDGKVTACDTGDVTVSSSALPTGAATAANQSTANSSLSTIAGDTTSIDGKITACDTGNVTIASSALPTGAATAANQSTANSSLSTIAGDTTSLDSKVTAADTANIKNGLDIIDQFDTPLLDTSSSNIPASAGSPLEVVASLAGDIKKIQIIEDIGSYIGIYTGAAASEVLKAVLPLGGGEVDLQIASGTRISLRALENTAISSGKMAINFQG